MTMTESFEAGWYAHQARCWLILNDIIDAYQPLLESNDAAQRQTARAILQSLHTLHRAGILRRLFENTPCNMEK